MVRYWCPVLTEYAEGAADVVVFVGCDAVMGQNLDYGQVLFDVGDLHGEIYLLRLFQSQKYN